MPDTFLQGLLAGLVQPLLGMAYLAMFVAAGLAAAPQALHRAMPMAFTGGLLIGAFLQVMDRTVPAADVLIALSVMALGTVLVRAVPGRPGVVITVLAITGALGGYGLTSFASGAQDAALYGYVAGVVLTQLLISYAVMLAASHLRTRTWFQPVWIRLIGAGILGIGLTLLVEQLTTSATQTEEEEEGAQVSQLERRGPIVSPSNNTPARLLFVIPS